jgi:hypothetical protein
MLAAADTRIAYSKTARPNSPLTYATHPFQATRWKTESIINGGKRLFDLNGSDDFFG